MLPSLLFGLVVAVVTALLAPSFVRRAAQAGRVDEVNHRSSHTTPTPSSIGLIFVITVSLAWLIPLFSQSLYYFWALFAGGLIIATLGWVDDKHGVSPLIRLLLQAIVILTILIFLPPILPFLPLSLEKIILLLGWLWWLNLYNFLDGIDGYAASQSIFLSIVATLFMPLLLPFALTLAGGCLGFLRVNWHTAKPKGFMGDVGSTWLGLMTGGLLLAVAVAEPSLIFLLITVTLLFSGDATFTLLNRLRRGEKVYEAHREHFYQRAVQAGLGHDRVTVTGMGINLLLFIFAFTSWWAGYPWLGLIAGLTLIYFASRYVRWLERI